MTKADALVGQGYIVVIADVRGAGASQGSLSLLQPAEATDCDICE